MTYLALLAAFAIGAFLLNAVTHYINHLTTPKERDDTDSHIRDFICGKVLEFGRAVERGEVREEFLELSNWSADDVLSWQQMLADKFPARKDEMAQWMKYLRWMLELVRENGTEE